LIESTWEVSEIRAENFFFLFFYWICKNTLGRGVEGLRSSGMPSWSYWAPVRGVPPLLLRIKNLE
jgi:hypothetical protein